MICHVTHGLSMWSDAHAKSHGGNPDYKALTGTMPGSSIACNRPFCILWLWAQRRQVTCPKATQLAPVPTRPRIWVIRVKQNMLPALLASPSTLAVFASTAGVGGLGSQDRQKLCSGAGTESNNASLPCVGRARNPSVPSTFSEFYLHSLPWQQGERTTDPGS